MPDPSPDTPSVCPTAPDGYVACRTTHGPGASSTVQVTHLVRLDDSGSNGGRPTMCGLTRFDKRSPDGWDVIELAAIPGWSMGGGCISGPGITQKACQSCWSAATPAAPGSSSPDTAALVGRLRRSADTSEAGKGEWYQLIHRCREAADALEAQDARITELEAAVAERNSLIGWLIMAKSCADHGQAPVWPLPAQLEDLFQQLSVSVRDDWDDWRWRGITPPDHTLTTPAEETHP